MLAKLLASSAKSLGYVAWTISSFVLAQILTLVTLVGLVRIFPDIANVNAAVLATIQASVAFTLALCIITFMPLLFKRKRLKLRDFGLTRLVEWRDLGLMALSIAPYVILSTAAGFLLQWLFYDVDLNQKQAIAFGNLGSPLEFTVAFITLVLIAPLAEEALFRGYLLGRLIRYSHVLVAIAISAATFGSMHLLGESDAPLQWAVALDTTILGIVLAILRIKTGNIWAGVLLHMAKNFIAFYFLFIQPITGIM